MPVPATIRALLAARLDQLDSEDRAAIQRASVIGKVFDAASVTELSSKAAQPSIDERLMALLRRELIRPSQEHLAGGEAFRFRHDLIRDAAHASLPKQHRAELHERFAGWLERGVGDRRGHAGPIPGARQLIGRGRAIAEEFRLTFPLPWLAWRSGKIELLAGDLVAAERELRLSYAMYQHMSEKDNLSTVAADLAGVLAWKGHTSESLRLTEESRVLAAREDVWSHTLWRSVQATVLAQQGQAAEAERLARAAGELAAQTDFLDLHTGVLLTLAEVLRSAGNAPRFGRCSTTQRCSTNRKATLCHWHVLSLCSTINGELHTWSENGTCCLRLACPERRRATATAGPSHCATGSRRLLRPGHSFRRAGPRSSRRSSTCLSGRSPTAKPAGT
jgi:hypothetical protein